MGLHKLTAGDGYTYLTRQVAVHDATERGHTGLGDYYAAEGRVARPAGWAPGWPGWTVSTPGDQVTDEQMKALFGEGRHPNADAIERAVIAAGGDRGVRRCGASALGQRVRGLRRRERVPDRGRPPVRRATTPTGVARWNAPVPAEERARIRTEVGAGRCSPTQYGRAAGGRRGSCPGSSPAHSRQATTAVAGYDLTFSPVKSVSALWAIAPREVAEQIEAAHHAAVADTLALAGTRGRLHPRRAAPGSRQVETTGLIAAAFTHRDSRAGDPDLHTHVAVSQQGADRCDGRWLALDGRVLFKANVAASERYNTRARGRAAPTGSALTLRRPRRRRGRRASGRCARSSASTATLPAPLVARAGPRSTPAAAMLAAAVPGRARPAADRRSRRSRWPSRPPWRPATPSTSPAPYAEQRAAWRGRGRRRARRRPGGRRDCVALARPRHGDRAHADRGDRRRRCSRSPPATVRTVVAGDRATWQVWHVRAEAERQVRAAGIRRRRRRRAGRRASSPRPWPRPGRSRSAADDPVSEPDAAAPPRRRVSVYAVAGARLYTSRGGPGRRAASWSPPPRAATGAPSPTPTVDAGAAGVGRQRGRRSTPARRTWSASWPPPAPGCSSRSPRPGPARPPPCASWPGPGPTPAAPSSGWPPPPPPPPCCASEIGAHTDTLAKLVLALTTPAIMPDWVARHRRADRW